MPASRTAVPHAERAPARGRRAPHAARGEPVQRAPRTGAARPPVRPRREPASAGPIDAILRAAGELLDAQGIERFNTTAVALRAGVSTATLYRHFADKRAVLRALARVVHHERAVAFAPFVERLAVDTDWRPAVSDGLRAALRARTGRPGAGSLRRALQTAGELWRWEIEQNEAIARRIAQAMRHRRPSIVDAAAERSALAFVTAAGALFDLAGQDERRAPGLLEEIEAIAWTLLGRHLDP